MHSPPVNPRLSTKVQMKKRVRRTGRGKVRLLLRRLVREVPAIAESLTRGSQKFLN